MTLSPQNQKVLQWLEQDRSLSTVQAAKELYILRLSERIRELKEAGYKIQSRRVPGKPYQQYWLDRKINPQYL